MKESLAEDILNSLAESVAVVDSSGVIVAVNEAWGLFAQHNGGASSGHVGSNYLRVCEDAAAGGDRIAASALQGVRAVLSGEKSVYALEYPCHGGGELRWFVLRVTRLAHADPPQVVVAHHDVTAQKKVELELRETQDTLRHILELLPIGVWVMDKDGRIVHGNPAGRKIWGGARYVPPEQFDEYRGWWVSNGKRIASHEWAAVRAIRDGETSIDEEIRIQCFDGTTKYILNSALPLHDPQRNIVGAIIVNQDITARRLQAEELARMGETLEVANRELTAALEREQVRARTDDLTGLHNRGYFLELATRECAVAARHQRPLAVVMIDIDHFKEVNDTLGHQAGDEVLRRLGRIVRSQRRTGDIVGRYGGEEFILLLPETRADQALEVAEHLRREVAAEVVETAAGKIPFTISAGVAQLEPDATLDDTIRRADHAMYAAKAHGRNRVEVHTSLERVA